MYKKRTLSYLQHDIQCVEQFEKYFIEKMISFLLSNESLCDGPTNGPGGRTPHFYSCFYDLNGMKLLFLWLLTSSKRFLFICFINQETFLSPQQQKGLLWNVFLCWKSAIYQTRNKLENWLQRIIFFPGLRGIEMDRNEIYVFDFPFSNSIQIKFRGKNFAKLHRYMWPPLSNSALLTITITSTSSKPFIQLRHLVTFTTSPLTSFFTREVSPCQL